MRYPNKVGHYRRLRGYTQAELGIKVNRRRETISLIENGHTRPSLDLMQKLVEVLDADGLDDLFMPAVSDSNEQRPQAKQHDREAI